MPSQRVALATELRARMEVNLRHTHQDPHLSDPEKCALEKICVLL